MKNLLLITDHFPPEQSGAVGRTYSLYKYLPQFGYNVIVITIAIYGKLNNEKNIYRFDSIYDWKKQGYFSRKAIYKYISKLIGLFYINYDRYWEKVIYRNIDRICQTKIDFIYSTYPHSASLFIGYHLSKKYNIPLITEFRDGFLFEPLEKLNIIERYSRKCFEKKIILHSTVVITIGKNLTNYYKNRYPASSVYTVYNGYNEDEFQFMRNMKEKMSDKKILIAYFGQFNQSKKRDIIPLINALKKLKIDKKIKSSNFELSLMGNYTIPEKKLIDKYKLNDIIKIYESVPKLVGLKKIAGMYHFVLLYGIKAESSIISSKIFEYLKLNKPIIGICKGNESEEIIYQTQTGEVADFDQDSIYNIFNKFLNKQYKFNPNTEEIKRFDRREQAKKIAHILNSL
jgi:glycosyltransferase involved in cell wall biosynthesis